MSYCPSCRKLSERFGICDNCIKRRDKIRIHSEEKVQQQLKKELAKKD